jgi:hypothetical protein
MFSMLGKFPACLSNIYLESLGVWTQSIVWFPEYLENTTSMKLDLFPPSGFFRNS